jgi:dTDP-4-dehydrorhamnose reductase
MRLLVFGAEGQLGVELCRIAKPEGIEVLGTTRREADITKFSQVEVALKDSGCALAINAAAYTAVDRAENDQDAAFAVNRDGAANIARACERTNTPLIHISTDYVFDGTKSSAYSEEDPVRPLNVYGESKEAGDQAVRAALGRHIILRCSWVYGAVGQNFVKTMLRLAEGSDVLRIVDDQFGCPTWARDIAGAILAIAPMLNDDRWGTYHFCNAGRVSWYGFAKEIFLQRAKITNACEPRVLPIAAVDYPTLARRPANSELDCSNFVSTFGIVPRSWRSALAVALDEMLTA